jgi:hypothetical protein
LPLRFVNISTNRRKAPKVPLFRVYTILSHSDGP